MSIQDIRDRSGGVVTKVIVGLIIVVFAMFGMGSITTFLAPVPKVATVNGDDITTQEMEVEIERTRRMMQSRNSDPNAIDEDLLRQNVLQKLVTRKLLSQAADDLGLQFSDELLDADIIGTEVFHVDGIYDPDQFQLVIGSVGYSPVSYRNEMRRDKVFSQLDTGIRGTSFITSEEVERTSSLAQQTRDVAFLRVDVQALSKTIDVSTEEIASYYGDHTSEYMSDETVDISYIEIKRSELLAEVEVIDADLLSFFEETREAYVEPERRRLAHILIETSDEVSVDDAKQKIDEIYKRIMDSAEDFSALAIEFSNDIGSAEKGGDLGFNDSGTFVEEFEAVAQNLTLNQVSDPVKTEYGYHILKLLDLEAATEPDFEKVRERVETEFRTAGAEEIFVDKSARLSEIAYEAPDLAEPSEELELELRSMEKVARTGNSGIAANPKVVEAAFSSDVLLDRNNSNLIEITPNHHVVVRVSFHQAREVKPLEAVSDEVKSTIALEKSTELAKTQAIEMVTMLEDGSITRFVADEYNLKWTVVAAATRNQRGGLDPQINREAFSLPRPAENNKSIGYAVLSNGDAAVISVTNVKNKVEDVGTPDDLSRFARILAYQQGQNDYKEFQDNLNASGSIDTR